MKTFPLALVLVLASGALISGHHSFAAHYFEEQSVTVQGTLVEFEYRNLLSRDGITKDTLKAGDVVIITGAPGRNAGENRIHLKRIERPADGWNWRGQRR